MLIVVLTLGLDRELPSRNRQVLERLPDRSVLDMKEAPLGIYMYAGYQIYDTYCSLVLCLDESHSDYANITVLPQSVQYTKEMY